MRWSEITVYVTIVLALALWWVWVAASRLDRLHRKVGTSRAVLDAQLVRRATVAAELATSGLLDPVSSVLVGEAAWAALSTEAERAAGRPARAASVPTTSPSGGAALLAVDRGGIESELSATLREALDDPDEVAVAARGPGGRRARRTCSRRPGTACSWPAGSTTRRSPRRPAPGAVRSSGCCGSPGTRPEPRSLELDDAWPENLGRPGTRRGPVESVPPA